MSSDKLASIDPMRLAWLLRAELRRGLAAGDPIPDWFHMWWAIDGRREYPAWPSATPATSAHLLHPMSNWPSYGAFGMTLALNHLIDTRADLRTTFDVHTDEGLWHAIAWFYTHGLREYRLTGAADAATLEALDETPLFVKNAAGETSPELTWLMFFVWRCSDELQTTFDLRAKEARLAYLQWFLFEGITNLQLAPLVSKRWHAWLREPIALDDCPSVAVPRAGYLMWQRRNDLQRVFDLNTVDGRRALASWTEKAWLVEPSLYWATSPRPPEIQTKERPFGLNLIGFAFGELGIGEDVRMAAAACDAAGIPYTVVNIHPGEHLRQEDRSLAEHVSRCASTEEAPFAINLFCLTGFDTARVALERGPNLFADHFNIGWWPWELPVWPQDWLVAFDLVDEVWAATEFTHRMYKTAAARARSRASVTLIPLPASVSRLKPMKRQQLGLPPNRFLFLYVFDFNSYLQRKNPFSTLNAFRLAFDKSDSNVGLVFKTMNSRESNKDWQRFIRECAKDPRVTVLDATLERGEVLGLIDCCDAYVSLHRSEGFGRTLAEAMLLGKPVVGTNFSGNVDFLSMQTGFPVRWKPVKVKEGEYPFVSFKDKPWWADASVVDAALQLQAARQAAPIFIDRVRKTAERIFSPSRIGKMMAKRAIEVAASPKSRTS
ncbi:MAG TPA: glycosyltransferase [Telluria sp.]|nr:glycosyltransferase [Telluria sp.]